MNDIVPCSLPVLILAAGQSSRMRGRDKLMEVIDGVPLIRRQAEMAQAATDGPVFVALPASPHPRYAALDALDITTVAVPDAALGMNESLKRGLDALPSQAPAVMVLLADLPDLTVEDLQRVCAAVDLSSRHLIWRAATEEGAPGHPIVFAQSLFGELQDLHGDTGGAEVVARHKDRMILVPLPGLRARRDLDTPEDWTRWRAGRNS